MSWFEFAGATMLAKRNAYSAWHAAICTADGIPKPGNRQSDGVVQTQNCWTDAYANPWRLVDGRLVIQLDADDPHAASLTPTVVNTGDPFSGDRGDLEGAVTNPGTKTIPRTWQGQPVTRTADNRDPTRT